MNKALSISGQQRFVEEGYRSLARNLKGFDEYDVFIHTWESDEPQDIQLYDPCRLVIDKPIKFSSSNVHYPMFYSMKQSLKLIEDYPKKYDCILRTRFDVFLLEHFDVEPHDMNNGVFSPDICDNPNVISDWFNFGNHTNIMRYMTIYDNITRYGEKGVNIHSGEELICHHLRNCHGVNLIKVPNVHLLLIRDDQHAQAWHKTWCRVSDLPVGDDEIENWKQHLLNS